VVRIVSVPARVAVNVFVFAGGVEGGGMRMLLRAKVWGVGAKGAVQAPSAAYVACRYHQQHMP
jgi:hypothetical protein